MASILGPKAGVTLVLGATGKSGRRVAQRLIDRGHRTRLGSRQAQPMFDWTAPETWDAALAGVRSVYLSYQPDLAVPGAVDTVASLLSRAKSAGVEHIVLLSGRGEPEAQEAEQALIASGLDWTVLRASWFMQNFSESFFVDDVRRGELLIPAGLAAEPFIDVDDIADVAVDALLDPRHRGRLYELTGPNAMSFHEVAAAIARTTGQAIGVCELPLFDFLAILEGAGVPGDALWLLEYLFGTVLDGRNTPVCDGVQKALARAPATIDEFAVQAAATGVWTPQL